MYNYVNVSLFNYLDSICISSVWCVINCRAASSVKNMYIFFSRKKLSGSKIETTTFCKIWCYMFIRFVKEMSSFLNLCIRFVWINVLIIVHGCRPYPYAWGFLKICTASPRSETHTNLFVKFLTWISMLREQKSVSDFYCFICFWSFHYLWFIKDIFFWL